VAQRVVEEVREHLSQPVPVAVDDGVPRLSRHSHLQGDAGVVVPGGCLCLGVRHEPAHGQRPMPHGEAALLGGGDEGDVLGEPREAGHLGAQHGHRVPVRFPHPVLDGLEVGVESGDRRAHLMRQVAEHPRAARLDGPELGSHAVERVGQLVELAAHPDRRHAGRVVPGRHPVGGVGGQAEGPAHPAGHGEAHDGGGRQCRHHREREGEGGGVHERLLGVEERIRIGGPAVQQVVVEDAWSDRRGHHPRGDRGHDNHARDRHEEAGAEAPPGRAERAHVPDPML